MIKSKTRALRYGIGVGREGCTWQGLLIAHDTCCTLFD